MSPSPASWDPEDPGRKPHALPGAEAGPRRDALVLAATWWLKLRITPFALRALWGFHQAREVNVFYFFKFETVDKHTYLSLPRGNLFCHFLFAFLSCFRIYDLKQHREGGRGGGEELCVRFGGGRWEGQEGGVCPGSWGLSAPQPSSLGLGGEDVHFWGWVGRGDLQVGAGGPGTLPTLTEQALVRTPPEAESSILQGEAASPDLARGLSLAAAPRRVRADCEQPPVCISVQRPRKGPGKCRVASLGCQRLQHGLRPAPVVLPGHRIPSALPAPNSRLARGLSEAGPERNCTCEGCIALCDSVTHFINTVAPFGVFAAPSPSLQWCWGSQMPEIGEVWAFGGLDVAKGDRKGRAGAGGLLLEQTLWQRRIWELAACV